MINDILTAIMARLDATEPNLKYMDEDWGQLDFYQDAPPVKFPCVLLELQGAQWRNQGRLVQDGEVSISIRVADMKLSNTSLRAPANQKAKAAAIWVILENIHKALHGWRPVEFPDFGTLARLSSRRVKRDDGIREFEVVYSCQATDSSAAVKTFNIASPDVAYNQFGSVPPVAQLEVSLKEL
jgi:hypothetical protein